MANLEFISSVGWTSPFIVDPRDLNTTIICYGLLGAFFSFFFLIIFIDMMRKSRTGELQETFCNVGSMMFALVKAPVKLCNSKNRSAAWSWITNLCHLESKDSKAMNHKEAESSSSKSSNSTSVIKRLAAKGKIPAENPVAEKQPESPRGKGPVESTVLEGKKSNSMIDEHELEEISLGSPMLGYDNKEPFRSLADLEAGKHCQGEQA